MKSKFFQKNNKGQSILEFAVILPFIFFFIFIHLQLCFTYILSQYANYVTYMSARTVLTNGHLENKHVKIVNQYIPESLRGILKITSPRLIKYDPQSGTFKPASTRIKQGPQYNTRINDDSENRNLGIEMQYSIPVFMPFLRDFGESLKFKSRTILGREPYHGTRQTEPWYVQDPEYGDSFGKDSACNSVYNDNGC